MANWFPVGKEGAKTVYSDKAQCELAEGQTCYDVTGKDLRYHTVVDGQLVEDAALKEEVLDGDEVQEIAEMAIAQKLRNMEFGKRILAIVAIRNDSKNLQPADVVSLSNTYAPIQALLLNGSIATAKAQIEAITPDGTLVTQADLDAILAEINAYLGV